MKCRSKRRFASTLTHPNEPTPIFSPHTHLSTAQANFNIHILIYNWKSSSDRSSLSTKMSLTEIRTSKLWTWNTLLRDHTRFVSMLPNYLAAYIIPGYSLKPTTIESVMVTMNTINTCPYCTGLHGQLARMAGVDKPNQSDPEVIYATAFAHESGRGSDVAASYDTLVSKVGSRRAQSVRALCWALLWGKTTGNTVNNARDKIVNFQFAQIRTVDLFVMAYYGPLFLVIGVLNKILTVSPSIPKVVSACLGAVLWLPQALNIIPLGVASIALNLGVV